MTAKTARILRETCLIALLIALAGCAGAPEGEERAAATNAAPGTEAEATNQAVDFTLTDLDGNEFRLSDNHGKVRLIDFWATWCAPCREEVPMFRELHETYGDAGFQLIAIAEEDAEDVRAFVDEHEIEYLNLLEDGDVTASYKVLGLPTAFLVDAEGNVVKRFIGAKPRKVLEAEIQKLLATGA